MTGARARRLWLRWKRYQDRVDATVSRPRWWERGRTGVAASPPLAYRGYYLAGHRYAEAGRYAGRRGAIGIRDVGP